MKRQILMFSEDGFLHLKCAKVFYIENIYIECQALVLCLLRNVRSVIEI